MGNVASIRRQTNSDIVIDLTTLTAKEKKMLISEWPRLMKHNPDLFRTAWIRAIERSTAIKSIFGLKGDEKPKENQSFIRLTVAAEAFFQQILVTDKLQNDKMILICKQLGARHVSFQSRGFQAMFWDIFMVCMNNVIDETLSSYMNTSQRVPMVYVWQRFVHLIVDHMRVGYMTRRRSTIGALGDTFNSAHDKSENSSVSNMSMNV